MENIEIRNPNEAVFITKYGIDGKSLFRSQVELATAIMEYPNSEFRDKKELTVRSAISQIFTGERNLSRSLRSILFKVIEPRFDKKHFKYAEFEKQLTEKFRQNFEKRLSTKHNRLGSKAYWGLVDQLKITKEVVVLTIDSIESHTSELADNLKDILLQKTGILPKHSESIESATYKFFLPNILCAREFWEHLQGYAVRKSKLSPKEIDSRFKDANKNKRLQTFLVPMEIAIHPYLFTDYSNEAKVEGFFVSCVNHEPRVAFLSKKLVDYVLKNLPAGNLKDAEELIWD